MAKNAVYKIGDVVMLRSGGPLMTVEKIKQEGDDKYVTCVFFSGHEVKSCDFVHLLLKKMDGDAQPEMPAIDGKELIGA